MSGNIWWNKPFVVKFYGSLKNFFLFCSSGSNRCFYFAVIKLKKKLGFFNVETNKNVSSLMVYLWNNACIVSKFEQIKVKIQKLWEWPVATGHD